MPLQQLAELFKAQLKDFEAGVNERLFELANELANEVDYVLKSDDGIRYDDERFCGEHIMMFGDVFCFEIRDENGDTKNAFLLEANEAVGIKVYCNSYCDNPISFRLSESDIPDLEEKIDLIAFLEKASHDENKIKLRYSNVLTTYYEPPISSETVKLIKTSTNPSASSTSNDGYKETYDLGTVIEELSENDAVNQSDLSVLNDLQLIDIGYIEI